MRFRLLRRSSYFSRLLISSLVIIIIALVFGYFLQRHLATALEEEVSTANFASLTHVADLFDARLNEAWAIMHQLSLDSDIKKTIDADQKHGIITPGQLLNVKRRLETMKSSILNDLFIYYPVSDRVLPSARSTFSAAQYLTCYYPSAAAKHTWIMDMLTRPNAMRMVSLGTDNLLFVLQTLPINNIRAAGATAVIAIDNTYVTALLQEWTPTGGLILFADAEGNVLLSSSAGMMGKPDTFPVGDDPYAVVTMDGERYVVQSIPSAHVGHRYLSIVPMRVFWQRIEPVRSFISVTMLVFSFLSVLTALLLTQRNYAPISSLMGELPVYGPEASAADTRLNEIDHIRRAILHTLGEQEQLQKNMRDAMLRRALSGRKTPQANLGIQLAKIGLPLTSVLSVVLMEIGDGPQDDLPSELSDAAMQTILADLCPETMRLYVLSENGGHFICILSQPAMGEAIVHPFCEQVVAFFSRNTSWVLTAAYGGMHTGEGALHRSYEEALAAMAYRAVKGPGTVIPWNRLEKGSFRYELGARSDAERLFLSCIRKNEPTPAQALEQIRQKCCGGGIRLPEEFKCYYFDMRDLLRSVAKKLALSCSVIDVLDACDHLASFDEALINVLEGLRDTYSDSTSTNTQRVGDICASVAAYIEKNYADPSMNIAHVGRHLGFSGQYLSRLFQDDQGMSIAAFITETRIRRASRLLMETALSVEEISAQCGFLSSTTFIRLYKKTQGVTPGAYRKAHKKGAVTE